MFRGQGYYVETEKGALGEDELIKRLNAGSFSAVGIRSKTKVTAKVIESVKNVSALAMSCLQGSMSDQADHLMPPYADG